MKLQLVVLLLVVLLGTKPQVLKPVKWSFTMVKKTSGIYEIHMTASIDKRWKIYSQGTPKGGPSPTIINFKPNSLLLLGGKAREVGELHKVPEPAFGVDVWYFKDKVDFVQIVKLNEFGVKTSISGTVGFMACDNEQCLPPEEVAFVIQLR